MKNYSLRRRLIARIGIPIVIATFLVLSLSYHFARREIEEVYDAQLVHAAKVLLQLTEHEITEHEGFDLGLENPDLQHRYERNLGFRIWMKDKLITASASTREFEDIKTPPGFSNRKIGRHTWRFFVFADPLKHIRIEVSERYDIRYELVFQLVLSLIVPTFLFLPVILLVVWIGVRKSLKPVVKISVDVDRRSSNDLSPIQEDTLPQEIAPLVQALNRLFKRLEQSFRREREFTDHAAHELRTPLAAMKTQTQVLLKKAKNTPASAEGLENLQASINRATHLVEQLLSLARLQSEDLPKQKMDLSDCLRSAAADIRLRAERKKIGVSADIAEYVLINGHRDSISILLGNLLDNAVKYTPNGGRIHIGLEKNGMLSIADTGPGLNEDDKARVFLRFVRTDTSGQSGSGLGLSIAQWIATAHGVVIELLDNTPAGLNVRIQWEPLAGE